MRITPISLKAPKGAEKNPALTPELMASVLAKYSRSNEGLPALLAKVDFDNPEATIAKILKFVDFGHASIGGLTGGIPVVIDGLTMYAAYKLFELSQMADGLESSTRYITMDESSLPNWCELGFDQRQSEHLAKWAKIGLESYNRALVHLDKLALEKPELVRVPANAKPAVVQRIKKNFGLDRARYFLPFGLKTNMVLIQTARMWTETISALLSSNTPELISIGEQLIVALQPYAPNLIRHGRKKEGWEKYTSQETAARQVENNYHTLDHLPRVAVETRFSDQQIADAISLRENRYDHCGLAARDTFIRVKWSDITIAELRDLNRHRTGCRYSSLSQLGFFLSDTLNRDDYNEFYKAQAEVLTLAVPKELLPYCYSLGIQTDFAHGTQFDKYVYTGELRTGMGAHENYARKYSESIDVLAQDYPKAAKAITVGTAEPE